MQLEFTQLMGQAHHAERLLAQETSVRFKTKNKKTLA